MINELLDKDFVRFCVVGGLGFVINFALLTVLYRIMNAPLFLSQLVAAEVSLFNNFLLHHHWTYKKNNSVKSLRRLVVQFHATSWIAIVGSAALVSTGVHAFNLNYVVSLVISSVVALGWNFFWSKYVIWKHHDDVGHKDSNVTEG